MAVTQAKVVEEILPHRKDEIIIDCRSIKKNVVFKHPLQNKWTMWYLENDRSKSWEELQVDVTTFATVEDFWSLYNHIKLASELPVGTDYSLFKDGIRPMWEDNGNKKGGRWIMILDRKKHKCVDELWLDVLLYLIGEAFENTIEVCGTVVNIRSKVYKISVWTADGKNKNAIMEIGTKLKELLQLHNLNIELQYQLHKDTMVKSGATINSIYRI